MNTFERSRSRHTGGWKASWRSRVLALAAWLLLATTAQGQSGGGYAIVRHTVDAGGGSSAAGSFAVLGTVGQADVAALQGGGFQLQGGFHRRATAATPTNQIFANGFE